MPGPIVTLGSSVLCSHGGLVTFAGGSPRFLLDGVPVVTEADTAIVSGCPFQADAGPSPCVRVDWTPAGDGLRVDGRLVRTAADVGLTVSADGVPQGIVQFAQTQFRVVA